MSERYLNRALQLAGFGAGRVSPNPMVGAVLVRSRRVVGEGWHRRFGGPHAEIEALTAAGRSAAGATLYVTMEPCCTRGKTGACTDALTRAGVRRVVASTRDPNPEVSGRGLQCLREAGVQVELGPLGAEARRLNEAYFCYHRLARPFFTLRVALTLDGMMAATDGRSQWITGSAARRQAMALRCRSDAVLVGVETVLRDNPRLTCRGMLRPPVLRVVLDSRLRTPPKAKLLREPGPVLLFAARGTGTQRARLERAGAEVIELRPRRNRLLDWNDIAAELYRRRVQSVLVEGGARVASTALESGIIDKVVAMQAPCLMGPGRAMTGAMRPHGFDRMIRLYQVRREFIGPDLLTEGYLKKKRATAGPPGARPSGPDR